MKAKQNLKRSNILVSSSGLWQLTATILVALGLTASVFAGGTGQYSIGVKFGTDATANGGSYTMQPGDIAGVPAVSQGNWNNAATGAGSLVGPLNNNSGSDSGAGVTWAGGFAVGWGNLGQNLFTSVTDSNLMKGYLDNGGTATFTFTNLPSALTANGYDVYVYALYDTPGRGGNYSILDANSLAVARAAVALVSDATPTGYAMDPASVGGGSTTGNYILFRGLTNANIQIQAVTVTTRAIVCAIQLVAQPEPADAGRASGLQLAPNGAAGVLVATWTNGAASTGALLVMRQGQPATAQPVDGTTYTGGNFGAGSNLGDNEANTGPSYVVFSGATSGITSTQTVSGMIPSIPYFATVYSMNGNDYSLASPPTASAVPGGTATNILFNLPSSLVVNNVRHYSVLAQYTNGLNADITATTAVTSTNTAVASFPSRGRINGNSVGLVYVRATNLTFNVTQAVTVISSTLQYDWSFNDPASSLIVTDSVVGAVGYVSNSPASGPDGNGNFGFDGTSGLILLPNNILTNYGGLTIELWANTSVNATWARFWDFGTGPTVNMFQTPTAAAAGYFRTAFTVAGGGNETRVNDAVFPADTGVLHQYVFTLNGATVTGSEYVDGVLVGQNAPVQGAPGFNMTPEDVGPTTQNYLGHSQYAADPYYSGSMAEFRIYNGPLSSFQVALDSATGPEPSNNITVGSQGAITSIVVTATSPVVQFQTEPSTVIAKFAGIATGSNVNVTTSGQLTFTSTNASIFTVDANGIITAVGPGTANLLVSGFGTNALTSITVLLLPPGITHRWQFNGDLHDLQNVANPAYDAILHGNANIVDSPGYMHLDGSGAANTPAGTYVELPPSLLAGYQSTVIEVWYIDQVTDAFSNGGGQANRNWAHVWDFGSFGGNNMTFTPFVAGLRDTTRVLLDINNAGETTIDLLRPLTNVEHHAVFVLDATNNLGTVYIDGQWAGQNISFETRPRDLGPTLNDWLGRTQYGDPLYAGYIDEFRIYNGTISPVQVGINSVTGPNNFILESGAGTLLATNLVVQSPLRLGNTVQATFLATFSANGGIPNAPVTTAATNWVTSDPTIARVDKYGRVTACGVGSANISATFEGSTATAAVTVTAPGPLLLHRYNFNLGDATDSGNGPTANGTVIGSSATFQNGMVTINDNLGYIQLPANLFDTNDEVTFEAWGSISNNSGSGAALASFGTNGLLAAYGAAGGVTYINVFATGNGNNFMGFRSTREAAVSAESLNSSPGRPAFNTYHHYAWVVSDISKRVDLYIDGQLTKSSGYTDSPDEPLGKNLQWRTVFGDKQNQLVESYIGSSANGLANGFRGTIDEFRIWSGALTKDQVRASYLNGPNNPSVSAGTLTNLSTTLSDTTMLLGTTQHPSVSGSFSGVGGPFDLTGSPGTVLSSDNSAVVAVTGGANAKVVAVGTGSAHVITCYSPLCVTNAVTVIARPTQAVPTHVYSFTRGTVADQIGHGDAVVFGGPTNVYFTNVAGVTALALSGSFNPPSYLNLPSDLISGYDLITFEMYYNASPGASGSQQRLWDFGFSQAVSGGAQGAGYIYESAGLHTLGTPGNFPAGPQVSAQAPNQGNRAALTTNCVHVVGTVDFNNHILNLYTNGLLAASTTNLNGVNQSMISNAKSWLGASLWADAFYFGTLSEFRVYYGLLTPAQIAAEASSGAGAGKLMLTVSNGPGANQVTVTWPQTMTGTLQVSSGLNPQSWSTAPAPSQVNGYNQVVVNTGGNPNLVYRLLRQ